MTRTTSGAIRARASTAAVLLEARRRLPLIARSGTSNASAQRDVERALRQLLPEAALIEFSHQRAFELVAFVEEGQAEREADILEDFGVFRPRDNGARTHHRRQIP